MGHKSWSVSDKIINWENRKKMLNFIGEKGKKSIAENIHFTLSTFSMIL